MATKTAAPRAKHVAREVRSKLAEAAEALKEVAASAASTGLAAATDVVVRTLASEAAPTPASDVAGETPERRAKLKSARRATPATQAKAAAKPKATAKTKAKAKAPQAKKTAKPAKAKKAAKPA